MSYSLWCTEWSNPFTSLVSVACVWCCWCYLHYSVQIPEKRKEKKSTYVSCNLTIKFLTALHILKIAWLWFCSSFCSSIIAQTAECKSAIASEGTLPESCRLQSSFQHLWPVPVILKKSCINAKARMSIWTPADLKTPNETCPFYNQKMWVRKTFTLVCSTVAAPCTLATVTWYTSVFNDAITSTASAMSGSVIFKDIRCVCFLSWISYTNSWTNPCCSCCGKEMIPFVMDPQNLELKGSQWKKCSLWVFPMWCLLLSGRACHGFSRAF